MIPYRKITQFSSESIHDHADSRWSILTLPNSALKLHNTDIGLVDYLWTITHISLLLCNYRASSCATAVSAVVIMSVCPSVRLFVCPSHTYVLCDKTKQCTADSLIPHEISRRSVDGKYGKRRVVLVTNVSQNAVFLRYFAPVRRRAPKFAGKRVTWAHVSLKNFVPIGSSLPELFPKEWFHTTAVGIYTVSKKVPTFKLSVTLSNVDRFSKFLHCWKAYEICYKIIRHYPPHFGHVATLPWEI